MSTGTKSFGWHGHPNMSIKEYVGNCKMPWRYRESRNRATLKNWGTRPGACA